MEHVPAVLTAVTEGNFTAVFIHFVQLKIHSVLITLTVLLLSEPIPGSWLSHSSLLASLPIAPLLWGGQASRSQHLRFKIVNINHKYLVNDNAGQSKAPLTVPAAILKHLEKGQFWDLFWCCPDVKLLCLLGSKRLLHIDKLVSLNMNHNLSNVKFTLCTLSIKPAFKKRKLRDTILILDLYSKTRHVKYEVPFWAIYRCSDVQWPHMELKRESIKGHQWECERNRGGRRDPDTCVHFVRLCLFACESDHV